MGDRLAYPVKDGVDVADKDSVAAAFLRAIKTAPKGKKLLLIVTGAAGLIGQGLLDHVVKNEPDCAVYPLGGQAMALSDVGINEDALFGDPGWNWYNAGISPDGDPAGRS